MHKQEQMRIKLHEYTRACIKQDKPEDEAGYKRMLVKRMLRYLVYTNQSAYLRHLNSKRSEPAFKQQDSPSGGVA